MALDPEMRTWIALAAVAAVVIGVQSVLVWRLLRALHTVQRLDEKLGHFGDALSLLTETTESGFRAVAAELDRVTPEAPIAATSAAKAGRASASAGSTLNALKKIAPRTSAARINDAARRGRTVTEIAAAEELSEGEVRLRLHLAKQAAQAAQAKAPRPRRARQQQDLGTTQEQQHGTVRA